MKKRLGFIALLLVAVLSFTACGGEKEDAYALYQAAAEKFADVTSMELDMNTATSMKTGDTVVTDMQMQMNAKTIAKEDGQMDLEMNIVSYPFMPAMEGSKIYYTDGYTYMQMGDTKIKVAVSVAELGYQVENQAITFAQDAVKKSSVEKGEQDSRVLLFDLDTDKALSALEGFNGEEMVKELADAGAQVDFGDMHIEITIDKDGNLTAQKVSFTMNADVSGQKITGNFAVDFTVLQTGDAVGIEFPDFSAYQEIDASTLG